MSEHWRRVETPFIGIEAFRRGDLVALRAREPHGRDSQLKLHLSVSHKARYPTWDELFNARYSLMPGDMTVAQILPAPEQYVNVHPFRFHLWEIDP